MGMQGWNFTSRREQRSLAMKANEADERGEKHHLVRIRKEVEQVGNGGGGTRKSWLYVSHGV
jgi:hypothetical protein